jgi:hypothetical protein
MIAGLPDRGASVTLLCTTKINEKLFVVFVQFLSIQGTALGWMYSSGSKVKFCGNRRECNAT